MPNNSFFDELMSLGGDDEGNTPTSPLGSGSFFDELNSAPSTYRGLPMDDWSPEEQKNEGWGDFFDLNDPRNLIGLPGKLWFGDDNPINRAVGKAASMAGQGIMNATGAVSDLFQNALNSSQQVLDNPDAFGLPDQLPGRGLDAYQAPKVVRPDLLTTPEALAKKDEWDASPLGIMAETAKGSRDDAYKYADLLGEVNQNLATKKDEGGSFYDELSADLSSGDVWEAVEDTAGMMMDVSADMAGMAASGVLMGNPVNGAAVGSGAIGSGMALSVFGDTYKELTKNESDSRVLALIASGISMGVQSKAEQIGWETALGKGAVANWFKGKATDSFTKTILARAAFAAPTESGEESVQTVTDIMAKNLPNIERDGLEAVTKKMLREGYEQIPDAAFVGFVFGGLLGGTVAGPQHAAQKLAAKDIAARFGNLPRTPEEQLAGALDQPPSEDAAKEALVDVVEQVSGLAGGDLSGFDVDGDGVTFAEGEGMSAEGDVVTPTVTEPTDPVIPAVTGSIGSDAGNGFVHAPQGYRARVSNVSSTGGVMLEKRSKTGQASSFYIGRDGKLIDAESINLADSESLGLVWKPSSPAERSAAEAVLREAAVMDRADPRRKEVLGRLPGIVSGNVGSTGATSAAKPKKKKAIRIDPDKLDALVDPFETETRRLAMWASAVKSGEKAADDTIKEVVAQQEQDRASIANLVNESDVDALGERMMTSIEKIGQERQVQVESVSTLAQQLVSMQQGAQPQWAGQQQEGAVHVGESMGLSTPEMVTAIQNKAAEVGVEVPESAVVDPVNFDWTGWVQEEVEMAKAVAKSGLKGPAEAVRDAVSMEPTHPIAQLASAPPVPTSGSTGASQAQASVAEQVPPSNASRFFALLKQTGSGLKAKISKDLLMVSRDTMISHVRDVVNVHTNKVLAGDAPYLDANRLKNTLRATVPAMSGKAWNALLPEVDSHINEIVGLTNSIAKSTDHNEREVYQQTIAEKLMNLEDAMLTQSSKGLLSFAPGVFMPNIRAANRVSRSLSGPPRDTVRTSRNHNSNTSSMAAWIKDRALGAIGTNNLLTTQEKDAQSNDVNKYMASYEGAEKVLPQVKQILFSVWDTAPQQLVDRLGRAISSGADTDLRSLAREVAAHVASRGMYLDLADEVDLSDSSAYQLGYTLINVGNGVMTPWAIENAANGLGVDRQEAKAAVAVMTAFAERWAMKKGRLPIEWWDRLADRLQLHEFKDYGLLGSAMSDTPYEVENRRLVGFKHASNYAHGMMNLFKTPQSFGKGGMSTILHESIHNLFMSGLMYEMLEPAERAALVAWIGEPLWDQYGEPMDISSRAHELMAVGFEKFLATNRAPNPRVRVAFEAMKDWFKRWINRWLREGAVKSVDLNVAQDVPVTNENEVPMYGNPGSGGVYLSNSDLDITPPIAKMFYQLMNAEPDGSEIAYMPSGLSIAVEKTIEAKTGVKADGLFTKVPPASVMTLPVFSNNRVVTADDLPGAAEAGSTKWFHGTGKRLGQGEVLSSLFSKNGMMGTGVYMTDDPKVANGYRVNASGDSENFFGEEYGDVYALHVSPRKVINLEKPLPEDVKNIVLSTMINAFSTAAKRFGYGPNEPLSQEFGLIVGKIAEAPNHERRSLLEEIGWISTNSSEVSSAIFNSAFRAVEKRLRENGYDALTHIGGLHFGKSLHRVLILLDPSSELASEKNKYPKTVVSQWSTSSVDVDKEEPGWNIHKGTIPTESEWRGMLGLTNDDDNGTHTQETLANMEEDRQRMGELSKAVKEQERAAPSSEMPTPVRTPVQEAAASVQKALATEKPLDDEPIYDDLMDAVVDVVMNSGKSGYNSGKKVDPSDPEQVKGFLKNFMLKMNSWSHLAGTKGIAYVVATEGRAALAAGTRQLIRATKMYESQLGNYMAGWERLYESLDPITSEQLMNLRTSLGPNATEQEKIDAEKAYILERKNLNMSQKALMLNNFHSLSKLADKIAEKRPQIWDSTINGWRDIPGAKSHMQIQTEFSQMLETYWKNSPTAQAQYKDWYAFHEAAMRDLRAWMFSARQFELLENEKEADRQYDKAVAERARKIQESEDASKSVPGAAYKVLDQKTYPEVPKPKVPRTTEEGNHWAESVKYLMEARYGKDVSMFKVAAAELTQWENHMVLDPLLASNMISEKAYSDMIAKGRSHIPMYRVRDAITKSGSMNPRIDDNTYKVVDYLKHDISMKSEDPLNSMLLKAAAIQVLTYRQAAKNALGMRILQDIRWWDGDKPGVGVSIFVDKKEVTKEEYLELQKDPQNVLTMTQRFKKNKDGARVESGHSFYHHVPYTGDDMKAQLKHVLNSEKAKAKYGHLTPEQRLTKYEQSVFAFFPEPGRAMYVLITDPELQKAFFHMNNPQALYANSVRGSIERFIDEKLPIDDQSDASAKIAHYTARALSAGYFGFNRVARGLMTSNPSFIFNLMPRDAPVSVVRSRHGLRWRDIPGQFMQSAALLFPSMRELDPGKYTNAEDASDGLATFSGLAAADLDGALSTDVMSSIVHKRGDKMVKAKTGHFASKLKLMWNDFGQFMAREGVNFNPGKMLSETKRGKNVGKNLLMIAASPLNVPQGVGQFVATIFENATRLAERSLTMKEDMSQYPTLTHLYKPEKSIKGKLLAGFTGTEHRRKWEAAKAKLKADPSYSVPQDALPVQIDAVERDYSMSHVTLNFPQKGYLTTSINQFILFNNPMHQDFYTNLYTLAKHRYAKRAVAYALGEQYVASENQSRMDEAAFRWIYKSFFYNTLPAALMFAIYGTGDDDDSLEWQAQSFIEKMAYFWIPTHKIGLTEKPFRVATGLGLNKLLFYDMPLSAWLVMSGQDKRAGNKWMQRFWDSTPPGMVMGAYAAVASNRPGTTGEMLGGQGTGYKGAAQEVLTKVLPFAAPESVNPMVEVLMDRDSWRNKAIAAPEAIYNEDPTEINREKYNLFVNTVTKKLGFLGFQPAQVKFLIDRYTPGSAKWIPGVINKGMEAMASSGPTGMPEDVLASNSPVAGQSPSYLPRVFAKPSWGMGNEFVQDLLHTAKEAKKQMNSYEGMVASRQPGYLSEHPLIQDDVYYGKPGEDGYRSGGLSDVSERVIEQNKIINEQLKLGNIDQMQAAELQKAYTLLAMEAMRNIITKLGE